MSRDGFRGEQRIGDWKVICDQSGFQCWASETVLQWDGQRVLKRYAEQRQPQDFVKGVADRQNVPWTRPEAPDTFISSPVRPEDL